MLCVEDVSAGCCLTRLVFGMLTMQALRELFYYWQCSILLFVFMLIWIPLHLRSRHNTSVFANGQWGHVAARLRNKRLRH